MCDFSHFCTSGEETWMGKIERIKDVSRKKRGSQIMEGYACGIENPSIGIY